MKRSIFVALVVCLVVGAVAGPAHLGGSDGLAFPEHVTWGSVKQMYQCSSPGWWALIGALYAFLW